VAAIYAACADYGKILGCETHSPQLPLSLHRSRSSHSSPAEPRFSKQRPARFHAAQG
jgi:hypothetical protein